MRYYLKTFGCQMNYADSEKINMILLQSGFQRAQSMEDADIVLLNTCSVRQKGEDRVFGYMREAKDFAKKLEKEILVGVTGCMVRKTGIHERYYESERKRKATKKISLLENEGSIFNSDDKIFGVTDRTDFVVRIEEIGYLTKILSIILDREVGSDDKWNDYLQIKQAQDNPWSANVIIQTGCDNLCTYCIVPFTRGRETSRPMDEIVAEVRTAVAWGAHEVTLLGQNVNSYGKESRAKLWDSEMMKWKLHGENFDTPPWERGWSQTGGLDHRIYHIPFRDDLKEKASELRKNMSEPEKQLWHKILTRDQLEGLRFLRQKPLLNYIVDFYCPELRLVIEIDGDGHAEQIEYDRIRTENLEKYGVTVVRYENREVLGNIEWVYADLKKTIERLKNPIPPTPFLKGEQYRHSPLFLVEGSVVRWKSEVKTPFRELLERVNEIDGLDRIRFTSSNPHDMTPDILSAHFALPRMCHYLHFALQSGSDEILKRMNRRHTYADFKLQLDYLRSRDPLFSISTDIIVGFPGETEEQFDETVRAFRECVFDFAYIARYSPRRGTVAGDRLADDVPMEEKARRWDILNTLLYESVRARSELMVGRTEEILISSEAKDETLVGRTRNFKEVFILASPNIRIGDIIPVKIVEMDRWVLRGKQI